MLRREFLAKSAALCTGVIAAHPLVTPPVRALAVSAAPSFHLTLLTDRSERAIREAEHFLQNAGLRIRRIRFDEYTLPGSHTGDLVFTQNGALIDFRRTSGPIARRLQQLAAVLALPRRLENPVCLQFAPVKATRGEAVHIFRENVLAQQQPLSGPPCVRKVETRYGFVELAIEAGKAAVVNASCTHKTCIKLGPISRAGQHLVCIPSRVRITISGAGAEKADTISF